MEKELCVRYVQFLFLYSLCFIQLFLYYDNSLKSFYRFYLCNLFYKFYKNPFLNKNRN